jgi:hypothetical protein
VSAVPPGGQKAAEDWLTAGHRAVCDGLSQFLAPEAGLREITVLHTGHANLLGTLSSSLDTQVGLAAILPSQATETSGPAGPPGTVAAIAAADPAVRLALRRDPAILTAILSGLTVRSLSIADEIFAASDLSRDRILGLVRALDVDLDRAQDRAQERRLDLRLSRTHVSELVRNLTGSAPSYAAPPRGSTLSLVRELALVLSLCLHHHHSDLISARAGLLSSNVHGGLLVNRYEDLDLVRVLGQARDLDNQIGLAVSHALGVQPAEGLSAALLDGALDDFTRTNLAHVDLRGRDLTGVRWSEWGTRWPPETDVGLLRARSREVAPGTGIYVITNPGESDKAIDRIPH